MKRFVLKRHLEESSAAADFRRAAVPAAASTTLQNYFISEAERKMFDTAVC